MIYEKELLTSFCGCEGSTAVKEETRWRLIGGGLWLWVGRLVGSGETKVWLVVPKP